MHHGQQKQQQQQQQEQQRHGVDFPVVQVRYSQAIDKDIEIFINAIRNWTESVIGSDAIQPFLLHQQKKSQHGDTLEGGTTREEEDAPNGDMTKAKKKKSTVGMSHHYRNSPQNLTDCLDQTTLDRMGRVLDVSLSMAGVHALDATVESILVQSLVWRPSLSSCSSEHHHWVSYLGGGSGAGFTVHCATKSATHPATKKQGRHETTNDHVPKGPEDTTITYYNSTNAIVLLDASCGGGGAGRLHHHPTPKTRTRNHKSLLRHHHHPPKAARSDSYYGYQGGSQLNVHLAHNQIISIVGGGKDAWKVEESILPQVGERNDDGAATTTTAASTASATGEDKQNDDDGGDDTVKPENENSSDDGGRLDFMDQLTRHMQACASHQQLWIQGGGGGGWTAEVKEEENDDDDDRTIGMDPIGRFSHRLESGFGFEFLLAPPDLMPWLLLEQQRHEEEEKEEQAQWNKQEDQDELDPDIINKEEHDDDAMHHSVSITTSSSATESSGSNDHNSKENDEKNPTSSDGGPQAETQQNCMLLTNYKRDWKAIGECWASNSARQQHGPTTTSSALLLLDNTVEAFPTHWSPSGYTPNEANDTGSVLSATVVEGKVRCFFVVVVVATLLTVPRLWRRRGYQTLPDH
jgi:hypothetical protein